MIRQEPTACCRAPAQASPPAWPLPASALVGRMRRYERAGGAGLAAVVDVRRQRDRPLGQRRRAARQRADPGGRAGLRADRVRVLRGDAGRRAAGVPADRRVERPHPGLPGPGQRRPGAAYPAARSRPRHPGRPRLPGGPHDRRPRRARGPLLRQAAAPGAHPGLPGPAGRAAGRIRRPGRGHRRLLGHRPAVQRARAGADRAAGRAGRDGPGDGAAAGRAAGGHPRAVRRQRGDAARPGRAGVGRAAAPPAYAAGAGRGGTARAGRRARVGAARVGHGGGHRRPRAGPRARRGLLPAAVPGGAPDRRGPGRARRPGRRPAGATRWPGCRSGGRTGGLPAPPPPGPPRSWWAENWPGACGSPIRPPSPSPSSSASSNGLPWSSRCCCSSSGTCSTCRPGCQETCSGTCSATAARTLRAGCGPSWTEPRHWGTTCPGRTSWRC